MTDKEYRSAEGISRSELWKIKESPEKFRYAMDHPEEPTPALLFGIAAHKMLLEPEGFYDDFAIAPNVDRRTKEGRERWSQFLAESEGKQIINSAEHEQLIDMMNAAKSAPYVEALLNGEREKPYFWVDELTGETCKARLDCLSKIDGEKVIVDYKATSDASTESFVRSAMKYGYDFQAAMYREAVSKTDGTEPKFVFIAQEKTAPYAVNILFADDAFIRHGYDVFRELLGLYHDCKVKNNWWGYLGEGKNLNVLNLPIWLAGEN